MAQYARAIKEFDRAARLHPLTEPFLFDRSMAKGGLGDWSGLLEDAKAATALDPRADWPYYDRAMAASLHGDYAAALAILNQAAEDFPAASAPRLYRGVLLDVLGQRALALADYRQALKDRGGAVAWNVDQAALAIWTIRAAAERAEAEGELRRHFTGRKPDPKDNWYGRLAAFLLDPHSSEAELLRDAQSLDRARRPWHEASACYYLGVRHRLSGDEPGAADMLKRAAATNVVSELQWYESELRVRIASGKVPAPQQPGAGPWRDQLPKPAAAAPASPAVPPGRKS